MCGINPQQQQFQAALLSLGLSFLSDMVEQAKMGNNAPTGDVLAAATAAYQQGKITKIQYIAVINALDEVPRPCQKAWSEHPSNREYLEAHNFLNHYRS